MFFQIFYKLLVCWYLRFWYSCSVYNPKHLFRELMLVADALRLGGAILGNHPDMLAPQLIGRLLPEIGANVNVRMLLRACDQDGVKDCALLPLYHCLHTPGGPLKVNHMYCIYSIMLLFNQRVWSKSDLLFGLYVCVCAFKTICFTLSWNIFLNYVSAF